MFVRLLGVENETEGVGPDDWPYSRYWNYVTEGSLRGDHTEFVLAQPLSGSDFIQAVKELKTYLENPSIEITDRCSLHVHVDARDLDKNQLFAICLLYTIFEYPLYKISGDRYFNKYCIPVAESNFLQQAIANLKKDSYVDRSNRYGGLNLNALQNFGSLEFRMHEGTTSQRDILTWCKILHDLVEEGRKLSPEDVLRIADQDMLFLADKLIFNGKVDIRPYEDRLRYSLKVAESIYLRSTHDS